MISTSSTSSFRISDDLRVRFEEAARQTGKGKNRILTEALTEYLDRMRNETLVAEARRQSLLASGDSAREERFWNRQADDRDWI